MTRDARPEVERLIVNRWSPRAFDGSEMTADQRDILLDAARWAPSAFNGQPWRFLYAHRGSADWSRFLQLLIPFNQSWVANASLLLFVLSDRTMQRPDGETVVSHSHSFDAGAAWALLALQAEAMGFATHAMTGVEFEQAATELKVPERFRIEAAVAVGRRADPSILPDYLQAREAPSDRRPVAEIAFAGDFPAA